MAAGILIIASLWLIAMFGAAHQDNALLGGIGYVAAGLIDMPVIFLYGADGSHHPSALISMTIYLSEAVIIAPLVYLIFFARK